MKACKNLHLSVISPVTQCKDAKNSSWHQKPCLLQLHTQAVLRWYLAMISLTLCSQ